ncbi:MAG: GNAT family N-acetyltransferase [Bacteroidia bacterium]
MKVFEVDDMQKKALFHKVLRTIYANAPHYIYPLEVDIELVFDPSKNSSFTNGAAKRWVLMNNQDKPIGRIAAFYNLNQQTKSNHKIGGVGFFECIDDEKAAFLLFDTAKNWLKQNGIMAFDGPINFGERDKFWGLLVDGFTEPTYLENYNPPYYLHFFKNYGFKLYFEQFTYRINRESFDAKRFTKVAKWISRKPGFRFEHFKMAEVDRYANDFATVYNSAWQNFENFKPISKGQILSTLKAMRNILIEDFIWFGYVNNQPAGIMVMIPDINQLLTSIDGKLTLTNKLKLAYLKRFKKMTKAKGLVFGVVPKYQKYGVETVMIYKFYKAVSKTWQYNTVELSWVGSFNKRMAALMQNINAKVAKKHSTYRYVIDKSMPFESYKIKEI